MKKSIDRSVKNTLPMGPHFISPESGKNIACVGLFYFILNWKKESLQMSYSKLVKKHEAQCELLVPVETTQ